MNVKPDQPVIRGRFLIFPFFGILEFMKLNDVRAKYLEFFKGKGHKVIPSASLIPENDQTTLFTSSGMQPLVPYLLGQKHPEGRRLTDSQKSFRVVDIDEVGDNRHTTFFEMLGNWSLGDPDAADRIGAGYFKQEQLSWIFEFLTKEIGLAPDRLWVTCFEGDEKLGLPRDVESAEIWQKLGLKKEQIFFYNSEKNWWSRSGLPENMPIGEPGGTDSEIFFDFDPTGEKDLHTSSAWKDEECHPNCDCGRFMEIGNSVFMEYQKQADGSFKRLAQRNVDFGGGLERITAASNDDLDVFKIDAFAQIISELEKLSGKKYDDQKYRRSFRLIADHLRAAIFLIADGAAPSNTEQGYFSRRLIRRAVRHADLLGIPEGHLSEVARIVARLYKDSYSEVNKNIIGIADELKTEETRFRVTLKNGLKEFEKLASKDISGQDAFRLFSSYGFPIDLIIELAKEKKITVAANDFESEMKKHQEVSRAGAEKKFKGGLGDTSEMSVKYHTATHLLHQALRDILGSHVSQKGSNITPERLRFDFTHPQKMTNEEKKKVVAIVNEKIQAKLEVHRVEMSKAEAEKSGALHFFGDKYGDAVSVHYIGDDLKTAYSKEFCGGPHIKNTSELGYFKIQKEEGVSAGVRRIKAVLEQ